MALTRIKTNNILDREVKEQDLADGAVTFDKISIVSGGLAGQVLKTDGSGNLYWELATGSSSSLDTLTDVDVTTNPPVHGDLLGYNSDSGQWEPATRFRSSIGLDSLIDVTATYPVPTNGALVFDGWTWRPTVLSDAAFSGSIFDLSDVNDTPTPTNGQVLRWNGSTFVAGSVTGISSIDELADVDTSTTPPVNGQALAWDGVNNEWIPTTIAGLGASSNTFIVNDIAARDLLSPAEGDSCYVRAGASGEYEFYVYDSGWVLISTADSARTDANTSEAIIFWNTGSPVLIGNVSQDSRVTTVTVEISTAFNDATSTLTVGDVSDNSRLLTNDFIDLTEVGTYVVNVDYIYTSPTDTDVFAYFNFGTSTQGEARVIVTHV